MAVACPAADAGGLCARRARPVQAGARRPAADPGQRRCSSSPVRFAGPDPDRLGVHAALQCALRVHLQPGLLRGVRRRAGLAVAPAPSGRGLAASPGWQRPRSPASPSGKRPPIRATICARPCGTWKATGDRGMFRGQRRLCLSGPADLLEWPAGLARPVERSKGGLPAETSRQRERRGRSGRAGPDPRDHRTRGRRPRTGLGRSTLGFLRDAGGRRGAPTRHAVRAYARVWQYRIYDTVNDPQGALRDLLAQKGRLFDDQVFSGEANLRVQGYLPRAGSAEPGQGVPTVTFGKDLRLSSQTVPARVVAGETLYPVVTWQAGSPISARWRPHCGSWGRMGRRGPSQPTKCRSDRCCRPTPGR